MTTKIGLKDAVLFTVLSAIALTLCNYFFMGNMQFEMLPQIFRQQDPDYLTNDLYTNGSALFNEDYLFNALMLFLNKFASLPVVFFSLNLLSNIASALAAFYTSRLLFNKNNAAGIFSVILVLSVMTMKMGYGSEPIRANFIPSHLVRPLLYWAIFMAFKQRPMAVGVLAALTSLIHPLEGPGTGGILLASMAIVKLINGERQLKKYLSILGAFAPIAMAALFYIIPYFQQAAEGISDELFIEINLFRFPHHYLPSKFFVPWEIGIASGFIGICLFGWKAMRTTEPVDKPFTKLLAVVCFILGLLCLCGYLFVEVWPTRIWLIAQTWRFLFIFKWIGQLLLGGLITYILANFGKKQGLLTWFSMLQPFAALITLLAHRTLERVQPKKHWLSLSLQSIILILLLYFTRHFMKSEWPLFAILSAIAMVALFGTNRWHYGAWMLMGTFIISINIINPIGDSIQGKPLLLNGYFRPAIFPEQQQFRTSEMAAFIKEHTPENSIIAVPMGLSVVRILAERALFVDLAIPMEDRAMAEWYSRVKVQHKPLKPNAQRLLDYDVMSINLSDEELMGLHTIYGVSHALLNKEKATSLEVLFASGPYKLVALKKLP